MQYRLNIRGLQSLQYTRTRSSHSWVHEGHAAAGGEASSGEAGRIHCALVDGHRALHLDRHPDLRRHLHHQPELVCFFKSNYRTLDSLE